MRLSPQKAQFIKDGLLKIDPEASVSLFGSRTDDKAKGGDIDIMFLTEHKVPMGRIRAFKREFYKRFGWQKIDIVNFTHQEQHSFKKIASEQAIPI
jgi:uncharacterized protein